jgi:hypothetical protein
MFISQSIIFAFILFHQVSDILYYEVLDIPLPELQCLKTLKVAFHNDHTEEVSSVCFHVEGIGNEMTLHLTGAMLKIPGFCTQYTSTKTEYNRRCH